MDRTQLDTAYNNTGAVPQRDTIVAGRGDGHRPPATAPIFDSTTRDGWSDLPLWSAFWGKADAFRPG
jgi:hypothetical protein